MNRTHAQITHFYSRAFDAHIVLIFSLLLRILFHGFDSVLSYGLPEFAFVSEYS